MSDVTALIRQELDKVGYFPDLVEGMIDLALACEQPTSFLVVPESTLGEGTIGWHVTFLAITPTRLVVVHIDDADLVDGKTTAASTSTAAKLESIKQVRVSQMIDNPAEYSGPDHDRLLTVSVSWGMATSIEVEPAGCADPGCEADHGWQGTASTEDAGFTVSTDVNGPELVVAAMEFTRRLIDAQVAAKSCQ
ncbi:MAG: DUF5998 family protein [Micrococcales bacterium]|nr:DUF5998 family protein [Micrococcales bacterium]